MIPGLGRSTGEGESEVTQLCLTLCDLWTVAHQAPPSMGFSRQEYWSGLPFPSRTQVSHIAGRRFNLCTTKEALKYKNPSTNIKDFKGVKKARLKEEGGGDGRGETGEGGKRGGLTDVSSHLQIPRHYGTFPWASREGRTGTWPYQKSEPEFEFSSKR